MPAEGPGHSFTMRDGTVLPAREVARGIYLVMNDEPRRIFDKIWKFLEAEIPTDRWPQFEAAFLEKEAIVFGGAALRVLIGSASCIDNYKKQ